MSNCTSVPAITFDSGVLRILRSINVRGGEFATVALPQGMDHGRVAGTR